MTDINEILKERGNTNGDYLVNTLYIQRIKEIIRSGPNWSTLMPHQKETLDMIAHKIGRILSGDPNFADHWIDISGYAKLTADRLSSDK
jgi:hypothetical protein